MSDQLSYPNFDSGAPKFPSDKREFPFWKQKMILFLSVRGLMKYIDNNES